MRDCVFLFPGQNSRNPQMLARALCLHPDNHLLVERASAVAGLDLARHFAASAEPYARNRHVQVGVFLASVLYRESLARHGITSRASLGLSLGEYAHLHDIAALPLEDIVALLLARGDAYDAGPAGAMAAVFPVTLEDQEPVVADVPGVVAVAMHNTPQQYVLSGEAAAVEAAVARVEDDLYGRGVIIEPRLPMHSPLYAGVGEALRPALTRAPWRPPQKPYLPNVRGTPIGAPTAADFASALERHVCTPVLWRQSIEYAVHAHPGAVFVELGPGRVLTEMLGRKWVSPERRAVDPAEGDPRAAFEQLVEELTRGS
jgi:[acyl-carrier-protein] S-malonyltransferase